MAVSSLVSSIKISFLYDPVIFSSSSSRCPAACVSWQPQSLAQEAAPECHWLGQDFKVDVVSPAEWAQSGPWESWVWCPASWPGSRQICSLCAQLSVCARNLVPQGLPSEFPVPGCSPESFGDRPWVLHLRSGPALFPAVQEDYPSL